MSHSRIEHNLTELYGTFSLLILDSDSLGVNGETPTLRVVRGSDGFHADFATETFVAAGGTETVVLTQPDIVRLPGLYTYEFVRADWSETGVEDYYAEFINTGAYQGNATDLHQWVDLGASELVGDFQVIIYLKDQVSDDPIVGVDIDIRNADDSRRVWGGTSQCRTDSIGKVTARLDAGTYRVHMFDPTHTTFNDPETITIAGNRTLTLYGNAFDPGHSLPATVRIFDWEYNASGAVPVVAARVTAWASNEGAHQVWGGVGHRDQKAVALTDADGYWYLDLSPEIEY